MDSHRKGGNVGKGQRVGKDAGGTRRDRMEMTKWEGGKKKGLKAKERLGSGRTPLDCSV